jgi:MFS family permease
VFDVLKRNPQFRKLWFSQLISQAGDWLSRLAVLALIARVAGTEEALKAGGLFSIELALRLMPSAFFGPLAGPVADRLPRRAIMITADLLRAGVVLGLLLVDGKDDLWLLYTLVLTQMSLAIFSNTARSGALPSTVPPEDLHAANALSAATWSVMLALGTSLGGLLLLYFDVQMIFVFDAVTYLISAALLIGLKLPPVVSHAQPFHILDVILFTDLRRGLNHVKELGLVPVLAAKTFWGAAGGYLVLISVLGSTRFAEPGSSDTGAAGFAIAMLYTARGLGTGIGPVLGRHFFGSSPRSLMRQTSAGFFIAAIGYSFVPFMPNLLLVCLCITIAHIGGSSIWVSSTTFLQMRVANEYRGRVFALEFLGMTLAFSLSGGLAGYLYDQSGDIDLTIWATSIAVVTFGLLWRWSARNMKSVCNRDEAKGVDNESNAPESSR